MSNPLSWFINEDLSHTDISKALTRRISGRVFEVKDFKIVGPNAEWFNSKFALEDYRQIFDRERALRQKYEAKIPKVKIEYTGFRFADVESEIGEEIVQEMHRYTAYTDADLKQDGGGKPLPSGDVSGLGLQEVTEWSDEDDEDDDDEKEDLTKPALHKEVSH